MRTLKTLGVAALAVLAIAALAPVAQAEETDAEFTAAEYPVTFSGASGVGASVYSTEAGDAECASSLSGEASEGSQTVEVHPEYSECETFGFVNATVDTNECNYRFHITTATEVGFDATADITCPEDQSIEIDAFTCSTEIPAQTGLASTHLQNVEAGVEVIAAVTGIEYVVTNDGFLCPFAGLGTRYDGEYAIDPENPLLISGSSAIDIG